MREIKFRILDRERKIIVADIELRENTQIFTFIGQEFLQYTGLKDKNGTEIYEADILHHKGVNYAVEWLGYKWTIRKATRQTHPFRQIYNWPINFEVIGNIYENPELLNSIPKK